MRVNSPLLKLSLPQLKITVGEVNYKYLNCYMYL